MNIQPFCRLTPAQRWRWGHRFQHVYAWLLYSLLAMKWQFIDDFKDVITGRIGGQRFPRPRGLDLVWLLAGKAVFFVCPALPLLLHPVGSVLLCYAAASITVSLVLAVTFQLAHAVEGVRPGAGTGPAPSGRRTRCGRRPTSRPGTRPSPGIGGRVELPGRAPPARVARRN